MTTTTRLLSRRRFLPLFCTQLLNAFNDNLYKTAMVLFVVYSVYNSEEDETMFSSIASALFIIPFIVFSALAGQLADMRDKARIIRIVKMCEFGIMMLGTIGLILAWRGIVVETFAIPLMLFALFLAGLQSTFLGPIKYAILPQHLRKREVLAGTGLVEAGTYIAILAGTILAGIIPVEYAAAGIMVTAVIGYLVSRQIPDAPPIGAIEPIDWNFLRSSIRLISAAMHDRQVWYAILAISFFWTIGAVLFIQFIPLTKNVFMASKEVASLFMVIFSVGVAIGSVGINTLLRNVVSAKHAPVSVIVMGLFVIGFYLVAHNWNGDVSTGLLTIGEFLVQPMAALLLLSLFGIAIAGGMFVVPLYAFLTTRVAPEQASRTIAANNIVNSLAMVGGAILVMALTAMGVAVIEQVLLSAAMCLVSAWLGRRLYRIECAAEAAA
ncbi:MFS transporter [Erythrobacter sp. QSSC1-22B]|uniref:MFS transporter n=1 Tax=Erythrobacter sp. QSSC1-22B TaxID=1860125 RepID=UPI000805579A|nr:MFS transporter [Erythrobacter sp. QSSC1-22B]OBX18257.1 MFS transporter [Erythrobacter sp. QSSC1-22B]